MRTKGILPRYHLYSPGWKNWRTLPGQWSGLRANGLTRAGLLS